MSDTLSDIFQKGKKGKAVVSDTDKETLPLNELPEPMSYANKRKMKGLDMPELGPPIANDPADPTIPKVRRGRKPGKSKGTASYVSVLHECESIANKRQAAYGDVKQNFDDISGICKAMFGLELSPIAICQVMIATKWARQKTKKNRDNTIDATNYTAILTKLLND